MANSKLVSTKYLLRLRSQEDWEGWHFRAKAHFRKSGAWRLISEGHPRDTGKRIQVELPDYRERVGGEANNKHVALLSELKSLGGF